MHDENRETSEVPEVNTHDRPVGEGNSRTAHVHASEESDSGVVCAEQRVLLRRVQVPLALE
jgi:hypothetical protein